MINEYFYGKIIPLKSDTSGVIPTVPIVSRHDLPGWNPSTDIYEGEIFINSVDQIVYTRAGTNIVQITGVSASAYDELSDLEDVTISATPSNGSGFIFSTASNTWVSSTVLNVDETLRSIYQETCTLGSLAAYSFAEGFHTEVSGSYAHAEGGGASASGNYSHAEGQNTAAEGDQSHAEGLNTTASGANSHAEGMNNTSSGICSHIEGFNNIASGDFSHAEGGGNDATGPYSHAENADNTASGTHSHAQGWHTEASGNRSSSIGEYAKASLENQMAHGGGYFNAAGDAQFSRVISKIQTTDATSTAIFTFTPERGHAYNIRVLGIGIVQGGTYNGTIITIGGHNTSDPVVSGYVKNIRGTITTSINKIYAQDDGEGTDANFPGVKYIESNISGSNFSFKVTGATSTTINWVLTTEWTEVAIQ